MGGESETILGTWMRARGNRDQLFLATKMGFGYQDVPTSASVKSVISECERSLQRLNTDYIDLLYIHADDPATPFAETLGALATLKEAGKIRYIGASNYKTERLVMASEAATAAGLEPYQCIQQRHTFLRPGPDVETFPQIVADGELVSYCASTPMQLLAYSPLLGGYFSDPTQPPPDGYRTSANAARCETLLEICAETGATGNQVVLAWMMQSAPTVIPLLGVSTTNQLNENLCALDLSLNPDQIRRLDAAWTNAPPAPSPDGTS